jgi:phosphoribosylanthranilate isomerase
MKFKIKICGVTSIDDALAVADAGADAIGLNFYRGSKRFVNCTEAKRIGDAVASHTMRVGVFVNSSSDEIRDICQQVDLQSVQLHGDEPPEFLLLLDCDLPVIRARRIGARGSTGIRDDYDACRRAGRAPDAILLDAATDGQYGGTGVTADWQQLMQRGLIPVEVPLILAGGLSPDNVAEAIRLVRPQAVDVASGVESAPGKKDAVKIRDFVAAAKSAFESI